MRMLHQRITRAAVTTALALTAAAGLGVAATTPAHAAAAERTVTLHLRVAAPQGAFIDSYGVDVVNARGNTYQTSCDYLDKPGGAATKSVSLLPGDRVRVYATADCYAVVGKQQLFNLTEQTTDIDVVLQADR